MAFGAISDVWFIILLTRADPRYVEMPVAQMHLAVALLAGGVVAAGLFAYGASLNDILDIKHDAAFSPDRPLPAGRIRLGQAVVLTVGSLLAALLAAESFSTQGLWIAMLIAVALLFYNAAGKFIPAFGAVTIGLIHAAHMFVPNHQLAFTVPIWMIMTHAMAIALTVHIWEEKRPRLNNRTLIATGIGWAFWSIIILGVGQLREGDLWPYELSPFIAVYPLLAAFGFILVARRKTRGVPERVAAEKLKRYGAMWQCLFGSAWLAALGLWLQAGWLLLFAITGFLGMTLIKEVTGYSSKPVTYRAQ